MRDFLDWLLTEAYAGSRHVGRCTDWLTAGLLLGALLIYFF